MAADEIAARIERLISLPRAYYRITEMMADERFGPADIARVVSHEPALTARLLRMVNSAWYGLPARVDTVRLAVGVVGVRTLHQLVLATSVATAFDRIDNRLVDVADFWHHSLYCGIVARLLSRRLRLGESEQVFVAGLLHDIGKLAIYHELPDQSEDLLSRLVDTDAPLFELERELLGFTHADVGEALLRRWALPAIYCETVSCHHDPERSRDYPEETALVHAANALSKKVEPGYKVRRNSDDLPSLHPAAAKYVALTPELVEPLRVDADLQSIEVYGLLFGSRPQ